MLYERSVKIENMEKIIGRYVMGTELVEKRNLLNEIHINNMTVQELRFFSIYLSKINARDISTRVVRFPLSDFKKIMELGKMNIVQLKTTADKLLCKIIQVRNNSGGYDNFQLFKECHIFKDEMDAWYIEIDAHDDALPLIFDYEREYFTYQLWNILRLRSTNQFRLYEILKQYEKIRKRIISVEELKHLIGITPDQYPRWSNFKLWVLDKCQRALEDFTDIKFTYEPYEKSKTGKIISLKFYISPNYSNATNLSVDDFTMLHDFEFSVLKSEMTDQMTFV